MPPVLPVHSGYLADPFVLYAGGLYYAYGTGLHGADGGRDFEVLSPPDLQTGTSHGGALVPYSEEQLDYWAPEVAQSGGRFYMYYSAGHGDQGHHIRVAVSDSPLGPFLDQGLNLTPNEPFAIDPHPFQDEDGQWYLYVAKDYLDGERAGTALAVARLRNMTELEGELRPVLRASADWQLFLRGREMYGQVYDWHTLEGAFVVRREGRYHLFYSGGNWTNETYGVGHAVADHPLGPWREDRAHPVVLWTQPGVLTGPGHNSVVRSPEGQDYLVFHAWDAGYQHRQMHVVPLNWRGGVPVAELAGERVAELG